MKPQDCSATAKRGHGRNGGFARKFRSLSRGISVMVPQIFVDAAARRPAEAPKEGAGDPCAEPDARAARQAYAKTKPLGDRHIADDRSGRRGFPECRAGVRCRGKREEDRRPFSAPMLPAPCTGRARTYIWARWCYNINYELIFHDGYASNRPCVEFRCQFPCRRRNGARFPLPVSSAKLYPSR
jgi:hypothetical protein